MNQGTEGTEDTDRGDHFTPTADPDDEPVVVKKPAKAAVVDPPAEPVLDADGKPVPAEPGPKDPVEPDPKDPAKDTRIPLARHKKMMDQGRAERDALVAQLAQYQAGTKVSDTNEVLTKLETDVVGWEGEYTKLVIDGKAP